MLRNSDTQDVQAVLEPVIKDLGYELVHLELISPGRGGILRLYIDQDEGITLEDCERVSHEISVVLDVHDPVPGQYRLEVSSPGLDRPLVKPEHFSRFVGHEAKIELKRSKPGRRRYKGVIRSADDSTVCLEVDNEEHELAYSEIEKARLVPDIRQDLKQT